MGHLRTAINDPTIVNDWIKAQFAKTHDSDSLDGDRLREQSQAFLDVLGKCMKADPSCKIETEQWRDAREAVRRIGKVRAKRGFSARDNAMFVFSLKQPVFARLRKLHGSDADELFADVWRASKLLDGIGLMVTEAQDEVSAGVIARQRRDLVELSTPVVRLWPGILAMPLIGTLDSHRAQLGMETLLAEVMDSSARVAILDITGVPAMDTQVAQHLIKTVRALRLMGSDGIISGVGPQIAQTIVQLGVELGDVASTARLNEALALAFSRIGVKVTVAD